MKQILKKNTGYIKWLSLFLIAAGILFRLSNYLYNHSLWLDEAWVAHGILIRTFKELAFNITSQTDVPAVLPVGFLIIEKSLVNLLGNSEYALRLFPFLCGSLSLILYWILLKKWTDRTTALIALSFFAASGSLIYYSAECKQYSGEVFATIVLYLSALYFQNKPASVLRALSFGIIGIVSMLIAHTAIFILAGIGVTHALCLFNKEDRRQKGYLFTYFGWLACFILVYLVYLKNMIIEDAPKAAAHMTPSLSLFSSESMHWLGRSILNFFQDPVGLPIILSIATISLGGFSIFKSDKRKFSMLIIPIMLMMIASLLRMFPFWGRFTLFLLPIIFLMIAQGISMIMTKGRIGRILGLMVFFILIWTPLKGAFSQMIHPQGYDETRPLIDFLNKNQVPGDNLFLNNSSQEAYSYYFMYFRFSIAPVKEGFFADGMEGDGVTLVLNLMTSRGKIFAVTHPHRRNAEEKKPLFKQRTWLLLSHLYDQKTEQFIKDLFDERGRMLLELKKPGASLYLYELNEPLATINESTTVYRLK